MKDIYSQINIGTDVRHEEAVWLRIIHLLLYFPQCFFSIYSETVYFDHNWNFTVNTRAFVKDLRPKDLVFLFFV